MGRSPDVVWSDVGHYGVPFCKSGRPLVTSTEQTIVLLYKPGDFPQFNSPFLDNYHLDFRLVTAPRQFTKWYSILTHTYDLNATISYERKYDQHWGARPINVFWPMIGGTHFDRHKCTVFRYYM